MCEDISSSIKIAKEEYYNRLYDKIILSKGNGKPYWTILISLFIGKKVPLIPPLLINNITVTDFLQKASLFNDKFCNQCTILDKASTLPTIPDFAVNNRIDSFEFSPSDINFTDSKS